MNSNGAERFLRTGEVVSYIAMEFWGKATLTEFFNELKNDKVTVLV